MPLITSVQQDQFVHSKCRLELQAYFAASKTNCIPGLRVSILLSKHDKIFLGILSLMLQANKDELTKAYHSLMRQVMHQLCG